jgi:hypothetical protein
MLKKDFDGNPRATLIQDKHPTRKIDSKSLPLGFDCFKILFHIWILDTFSTASVQELKSSRSSKSLPSGVSSYPARPPIGGALARLRRTKRTTPRAQPAYAGCPRSHIAAIAPRVSSRSTGSGRSAARTRRDSSCCCSSPRPRPQRRPPQHQRPTELRHNTRHTGLRRGSLRRAPRRRQVDRSDW